MKKLLIILIIILFFSTFLKVNAYSWGIPSSRSNTIPYPGDEYQDIIKRHNSYYIGSNKKEVYLTFDTGYEIGNTSLILDTLKSKNVKATFFITGHFIKENPLLVKRMSDEGHIAGNHTWNHPDITKLSYDEIKQEIELVENEYKSITGKELDKFIRPPEGKFDDNSLDSLDKLGYNTIFWSLAYKDWMINDQHGKDYAYNNVINKLHNGAIILLHTVSKDNQEALSNIIDTINENYQIKTLYDLMVL